VVFYQPKYDIQGVPPRLASAEALIRWKHPDLGMSSPGDFVPLLEGNGLIGIVDNYVWRNAAKQVVTWKERYGFTIPVSVNLSRSDVYDPSLVEQLQCLILDNGLEYSDLKLEVTESAYTDNADEMISMIENLRDKGFEIEMDDFGSGYSTLNMLSSLPIDVLKMDMKFIRNVEKDIKNFRLIELVLDIAKFLDVPVVAEGVETEEQMKMLRDAKCELVQGFFFSRPLPPEVFEELIKKEMEHLKPLPNKLLMEEFIRNVSVQTVPQTLLVSHKGSGYSVPAKFIGKRVKIVPSGDKLYIYHNTELIAIHEISGKKMNYHEGHYASGLRQNMPANISDDEIHERAKENLALLDQWEGSE
jgi:EAL domain-containing protein (putative c-di-GMP-specific phosphodiesterase class I)